MILLVKDIDKVKKSEHFDLNAEIQMAEIREYEKQVWENNQFCNCGADSINDCECDSEKQKQFRKSRKRKVNKEFDEELRNLMNGCLPKTGERITEGDSSEQG